jgi:hypothetical protein
MTPQDMLTLLGMNLARQADGISRRLAFATANTEAK